MVKRLRGNHPPSIDRLVSAVVAQLHCTLPSDFTEPVIEAAEQVQADQTIGLCQVLFGARKRDNHLAACPRAEEGFIEQLAARDAGLCRWKILEVAVEGDLFPRRRKRFAEDCKNDPTQNDPMSTCNDLSRESLGGAGFH